MATRAGQDPVPRNEANEFRRLNEEKSPPRVVDHYRDMRRYQTIDFYKKMEKKYSFENEQYRKLMTIEEAFAELEHYVVGGTNVCCKP